MSARRRRIVAEALRLLAELHDERSWWSECAGRLLAYAGRDRGEALMLGSLACARWAGYPELFDLGLDYLLDARNQNLTDDAALAVPRCHGERLRKSDEENNRLAAQIAAWWELHSST